MSGSGSPVGPHCFGPEQKSDFEVMSEMLTKLQCLESGSEPDRQQPARIADAGLPRRVPTALRAPQEVQVTQRCHRRMASSVVSRSHCSILGNTSSGASRWGICDGSSSVDASNANSSDGAASSVTPPLYCEQHAHAAQIPCAEQMESLPITTAMVYDIPLQYTQEMLYQTWVGSGNFDFLYLPRSSGSIRNQGFAFINFSTEAELITFRERWEGVCLDVAKPGKCLKFRIALVQGLHANIELHTSSSRSQLAIVIPVPGGPSMALASTPYKGHVDQPPQAP